MLCGGHAWDHFGGRPHFPEGESPSIRSDEVLIAVQIWWAISQPVPIERQRKAAERQSSAARLARLIPSASREAVNHESAKGN